jgi:hypothetical protein
MNPIQLAEQGWHLVPWTNRKATTRQPIVQGYLKTKPSADTVRGWTKQYPDCEWAVVPVDHVVLDIEMKGGLNGEADLAQLEETYGKLPEGPAFTTYNKGRHLWFRLPEGCELKGGVHIAPGIEIKCRNGTAHIPPSEGYATVRELQYDCPLVPDWVLELWSHARTESKTFSSNERFNVGERHAGLCSFAGKLRNMGLSEEAIFLGLQGVRLDKCEDPDSVTDEELRGIAKSYAKKDADSYELRVEQKDPIAMVVENFFSKIVDHNYERAQPAEASLPTLDGKLLRPTQLIAEWVDWVLGNADRPQPELSLLAACVGIGGIIGRKLTWHHSHANIYGLGLASSGSGKDAPLHSINKVYTAAGFSDMLGASRLGSDAGMLTAITVKPSIVWALDEISLLLGNINKAGCPGYLIGIVQYLLELYSCNPHSGIELKGVPSTPIPNPYPCILGFTQPEVFATVFNEGMANNGLMGRFVPFMGENLPDQNFNAKRDPPPATLIQALKTVRTLPGSFAQMADNVGTEKAVQEIACDEVTRAHYMKRCQEIEARTQAIKVKDPMEARLLSRTMEKAQKFSLIHAWSLNPSNPTMTIASIDWGISIIEYSNACMKRITTTRVSNPQEEMVEYLYDCVCRSGMTGIPHGKLTGIARRVDRNRRDAIMKDLIESGRIVANRIKKERGPATFVYVADKFVRTGEGT